MSMYLARTTRTLNSNLNPYPRIIAASALRSYPARQVQNQRTLWNFSWFTGGNSSSSSSTSSSSSAKKDESGNSSGSGNGGKVEVEMDAIRGTKRESNGSTLGTTTKTKMMMTNSGDDPAVPTPAATSTPATTPASAPSSATTSNAPDSAPTTPQQTSREEKEKLAIQALLDRDGGSLGFEFEDGQPEGGARKGVKREMFRVI